MSYVPVTISDRVAQIEADENRFDPRRHKVYRVNATIRYETFVVAESPREAEEIAGEYGHDDFQRGHYDEWDFDADEIARGPWSDDEPHGPILWGGKKLTVDEALALIADPPPEGCSGPPAYDTATVLMPFVDAPPPRWVPEEEGS